MQVQKLRQFADVAIANRGRIARAVAPVALTLLAGSAFAQQAPAVNLETILNDLIASMAQGLGTIFKSIAPIMVLTFGVAYAWKWMKKV